jgi:hypothetical protein
LRNEPESVPAACFFGIVAGARPGFKFLSGEAVPQFKPA